MARMIYFRGNVQGVGFRATAASLGQRCGISGWVRNMPDGKVQLWVQGDEESVERFLTRLREAMEGHIEGEDSYEYPDEEMEGFQIVW